MHLVLADMDGRAFVPGAVMPAVAGPGAEIGELVVAAVLPDSDLAGGQPDMREMASRIDGSLIAAIEARHVVVEASQGRFQRVAHGRVLRSPGAIVPAGRAPRSSRAAGLR